MPLVRTLTTREKAIAAITAAHLVAFLAYRGFLGDFIQEYRTTSQNIIYSRQRLAEQHALLAKGESVDARFGQIQIPTQDAKKSPQAIFTEEIDEFLGHGATISPHTVRPVPRATEFAYIVLNVSGVKGDLVRMVSALKGFHARNLLVEDLNLRVAKQRVEDNPELEMIVTIARLVRAADLDDNDRRVIDKKRQDSSASRPSSRRSSESEESAFEPAK